jgi:hypothetical protein
MISILKKQQDIVSFKAEVEGDRVKLERQNHSKIFMLCFYLEGPINEKAARAAQLSSRNTVPFLNISQQQQFTIK